MDFTCTGLGAGAGVRRGDGSGVTMGQGEQAVTKAFGPPVHLGASTLPATFQALAPPPPCSVWPCISSSSPRTLPQALASTLTTSPALPAGAISTVMLSRHATSSEKISLARCPRPTPIHSYRRTRLVPSFMPISLEHVTFESRAVWSCSPVCPQHPTWCQHMWVLKRLEWKNGWVEEPGQDGAIGLFAHLLLVHIKLQSVYEAREAW